MVLPIGSCGLVGEGGYRRGQFELDTVGILEGKHVNAERRQPGDLAMRHALLVEQSHGLLQVLVAGDPRSEMVQAHAVGIEAIAGGAIGRRPSAGCRGS